MNDGYTIEWVLTEGKKVGFASFAGFFAGGILCRVSLTKFVSRSQSFGFPVNDDMLVVIPYGGLWSRTTTEVVSSEGAWDTFVGYVITYLAAYGGASISGHLEDVKLRWDW
jgi:hypothetical protein